MAKAFKGGAGLRYRFLVFWGIDYSLHLQGHPSDHGLHIWWSSSLSQFRCLPTTNMEGKKDKNHQILLNREWIDENKTLKYWIRTVVGWGFSASLSILPWINNFSKYSFIPITRMWLVASLLSLCPVCLINKLFWLTIFSCINEQLQAKDMPCPSCDVYYKGRKK